MALLWLVFKWLSQPKVDNSPSWAEDKGGQEVVGKAGSSVEAFIRNRVFPFALSHAFGHT